MELALIEAMDKLIMPQRVKSRKSEYKEIKKRNKKLRKQRKYDSRIPKKYSLYIKSPFWEKRRNKFFREFARVCSVCGSSKYVQLHHSFYGEYGNEKDEHLVPMCEEHHKMFHDEIGKTKKDMTKETFKFILDNYNPFER